MTVTNVRFWTIADKAEFWPGTVCPLMTQADSRPFPNPMRIANITCLSLGGDHEATIHPFGRRYCGGCGRSLRRALTLGGLSVSRRYPFVISEPRGDRGYDGGSRVCFNPIHPIT